MAPSPEPLGNKELDEWTNQVEEVTSQIRGIIDGTITDFAAFDQQLALKERAKQIRQEELAERRQRALLQGCEGKGEGTKYRWWCKRCFVEYSIDLAEGKCTRCGQSDKMMSQEARRAELMEKLDSFKEEKAKHKWRKDKWNRWKKSQALLGKSRFINYKAWEYWEPDTDSEEEGDPIVPRDNPEFLAMEADMKERKRKQVDKAATAEKCRQRGNQCMLEGDYVGAIENYEEGLEYRRDCKALWTNKALAELKVFRWHDVVASCNKVIEYSEIFEDGFQKSPDACFKAFSRRAQALRGLHRWEDARSDLEDALEIYPKNKEALELLEKTKLACLDAARAQEPVELPELPEPSGPRRVEIEESDEETEKQAGESLRKLSKQDFGKLLKRLKESESERIRFCAREPGSVEEKKEQWVGKKLDLKVSEVPEASALDQLLRDVERCAVLFRKRQVRDGRRPLEDDEPEAQEADDFVELVTPRALAVLEVVAKGSEHHCGLTAPALRHVWPLLHVEAWRSQILQLLFLWSQCSISGKVMAEFATRYPEHLESLMELVGSGRKEDLLPEGFEDQAKKAADRMQLDPENAMEDFVQSMFQASPIELAISSLGNLMLAGAALSQFQAQIMPLVPRLVSVLRPQLQHWRTRGRAAGALCNLLRLRAEDVEQCCGDLIDALRDEARPEAQERLEALKMAELKPATAELLGALLNLAVTRPETLKEMERLKALELITGLIDAKGFESPAVEVGHRALQLAGRLVAFRSAAPPELLPRLRGVLEALEAQSSFEHERWLELLDPALRLLVTLLTKVPELLEQQASNESFKALLDWLFRLTRLLKLEHHLGPEEANLPASRLRGNLALLLSHLAERPELVDLSPLVPLLLEMMRRERGAAQHNLGVCITKLAQQTCYRELIRELNGLNSLHQIQLPKLNAQKEKEQRMHRLETSAEDRRRAIAMRR